MEKESAISIVEKIDFNSILENPILDIGARFWDKERYSAFASCYKAMRVVDDLVDNKKSEGELTLVEKEKLVSQINSTIFSSGKVKDNLLETISKFKISTVPWERFAKSMIYDINNAGFKSIQSFLDYAEGAAIAPASIMIHLSALKKEENEFVAPEFDVIAAARPMAIFAYLVHIIRDFQKDANDNLNYFADELLLENNLTVQKLKEISDSKKVSADFRNLIKKYYSLADEYRVKAQSIFDSTFSTFEPRYYLGLKVIFSLYLQVFERIDVTHGNFTTEELNPTALEVKARITRTITDFEF